MITSNSFDEEAIGCIVGAVVQLKTNLNEDGSAAVRQRLAECEGVEIHAEDEQSRLVITMEAATSRAVLKLTESIQNFDGILQVTPVYQHSEDHLYDEQTGGWKWR